MAKAKPAAAGLTKCRVLRDCSVGLADSVVELDGEALAVAHASGAVDSDPAAVAYAESLVAADTPAEE